METNNFLFLPTGMRDGRGRATWVEDSGYYSYATPIHCLYHLFDLLSALKASVKEINVWMISQLLVTRRFTDARAMVERRNNSLYERLGNGMFTIDHVNIFRIVDALSEHAPSTYRLTMGDVIEEWRLYQQRGGEL